MAQFLFIGHIAWQLIAGIVTLVFFAWDKRQAKKRGWRTPEKRLHFLTMIGGWGGAAAGQKYLRHKSQKISFKLITILAALIHLTTSFGLAYWWLGSH